MFLKWNGPDQSTTHYSEDDIKPRVVYNSAKLSQYFNIKDLVPQKCKSDIVYKCTCLQTDCNESYIGETERRFEERITDHNKRDKKSHIYKHSSENSHPNVWFNNFQIVGRKYGNRMKRKIDEALLIDELKPTLNKQDKHLYLKGDILNVYIMILNKFFSILIFGLYYQFNISVL